VNGTQRCDWWREPGVRRSASGSYKAADCFSSADYSNLDLQQSKGAMRLAGWLLLRLSGGGGAVCFAWGLFIYFLLFVSNE